MTGPELKEKVVATRIPFTEIAEKMGVTAQSLNSTFKSTDVRSNTIEKIAAALCVPMSYFYPEEASVDNTNNNNVRTQRIRNQNNGSGVLTDNSQQSSSEDKQNLALLIKQNQDLIDILKTKM